MYFEFEKDFTTSLRCIPMQVRFHLDACGIKLKLEEWCKFSRVEKENLANLPCQTASETKAYRQYVMGLVEKYTGKQATDLMIDLQPLWAERENVPALLQEKAGELNLAISLQKWNQLLDLQRFALIKLAKSGHESVNFPKAISEFGI